MRCASCGFDNPEGMSFCGKCGISLNPACPQCGFANPADFTFCGKCGTPLISKARGKRVPGPKGRRQKGSREARDQRGAASPILYTPKHLTERILAEQAAMEGRGAVDGERKTITALFADLKGSTALIEGLDPEEARALIDPALQLMMDAVHRYDGYVAQALGDGIFALFGAPIAHEDHPQRALYAAEHLEQSLALYNPQQHHSLAFMYGEQDPGVICQADIACLLWLLGYPDQALQQSHQARTLAGELSHPFSLAFALFFAAMLHQYRREEHAAQERAEATMTLATEHGFPNFLALGTLWRGWALAERGQVEEGIVRMRQGLAALRAIGYELAGTWYLALLAEAQSKMGQTKEGLTLLAEALAIVDKSGERFYEAELYRLSGQLILQQGKRQDSRSHNAEAEAEACFLKAIEIAQKQQAKSLELRAVMRLSRLWQQQGKHHAARHMLSEIYGWFTEGFETKDLKDAKALLKELLGE